MWVSIKYMANTVITDTKKKITNEAVKASNVKLVRKGSTIVSFKLTVGKVSIAGKDLYTNEAIAAITPKKAWEDRVPQDYIHALFVLFAKKLMNVDGIGGKKLGTVMNKGMLGELRLPILDEAALKAFMTLYNKKGASAASELQDIIWQKPAPVVPD